MMIVRHLYISGINKTNYVCAWISLQQHMVIIAEMENNSIKMKLLNF